MGALVKLEKINASGGVSLRYTTNVFDSFSIDLSTPVSPLPLPEETDDDNVLVKVEGNTTTIKFSWIIKDETSTTVSSDDGTLIPASVLTANEQVLFFMNMFQPKSIDDKFRIFVDDTGSDIKKSGFFTKFTFRKQNTETVTYRATADFIVGDVITVFESDAPSQPTGVSASTGTSGAIVVNWTTPASEGGSAITGYKVSYRQQLADSWQTTTVGVVTSTSVSGLDTSTAYQVRVQAINSQGTGAASNPIVEAVSGA
jgi:hypothetical protein